MLAHNLHHARDARRLAVLKKKEKGELVCRTLPDRPGTYRVIEEGELALSHGAHVIASFCT